MPPQVDDPLLADHQRDALPPALRRHVDYAHARQVLDEDRARRLERAIRVMHIWPGRR